MLVAHHILLRELSTKFKLTQIVEKAVRDIWQPFIFYKISIGENLSIGYFNRATLH
jgi:hypothetical protein